MSIWEAFGMGRHKGFSREAGLLLDEAVELAGSMGVAGVTLEFVRKDLESGDIRLLKTDFTIPERSVDMCTLKEVPPTAAASAFMEMVQKDG